jgi:amidohydrolase
LLASANIVVALQSVVSRNVDPVESAVVSVCQIQAGTADNVIAGRCNFTGAVRTFSDGLLEVIHARIREISSLIAAAHGCRVEVDYKPAYPATVNDEQMTAFAMDVAESVVGFENISRAVKQTMAGEDFAFMLKARPGCYAFIGNGDGSHRSPGAVLGPCDLHNENYDFNDEILSVGSTYFAELALCYLK